MQYEFDSGRPGGYPTAPHRASATMAPSSYISACPPLDDLDQSPTCDQIDPAPVPEYQFDQTVSW